MKNDASADNQLLEAKPIPTQARALAKRQALLEAAAADFQTLGYDNTTAKTIAERAEVATGTFYQYFHNKDDILRTIAQQRFDYLFTQVEGPVEKVSAADAVTLFRRVLSLIYDFHARDAELHQVLEQRRHCDLQLATLLSEGEAVLEQRVLQFVQTFEVDQPDTVAFNLFAMAEGIVHRHVFAHSTTSGIEREDVIELGAQMLASYFSNR